MQERISITNPLNTEMCQLLLLTLTFFRRYEIKILHLLFVFLLLLGLIISTPEIILIKVNDPSAGCISKPIKLI